MPPLLTLRLPLPLCGNLITLCNTYQIMGQFVTRKSQDADKMGALASRRCCTGTPYHRVQGCIPEVRKPTTHGFPYVGCQKKKLQSCLFGLIGAETAPPGAGFSKVAKSAVFFQGRLGGLFFLWGPSRTTEDIWSLPAFVCERKRGHALQ